MGDAARRRELERARLEALEDQRVAKIRTMALLSDTDACEATLQTAPIDASGGADPGPLRADIVCHSGVTLPTPTDEVASERASCCYAVELARREAAQEQ